MGCGLLTNPISVRLVALSTSFVQHWCTSWLEATGLDSVMAAVKAADASANFGYQLVMQTAAVRTDNPDQPSTLGSLQTGAGSYVTTAQDVSQSTASKLWVRFGLGYKITTGSGPEQADVNFQLQYTRCGKMVGAWAGQVVATQGTTGLMQAVSGWIPSMQVTKIKAGFIVNSATSNLRVRLVYRLAGANQESPTAWSPLGSVLSPGENCTGELTPTIGTQDMWVQIGLEYSSSDANLAQGYVAVSVGVRK